MSDVHDGPTNADGSGAPLLDDPGQQVELQHPSMISHFPAHSDHAPFNASPDESRKGAPQTSTASERSSQRRFFTRSSESWFSVWLWELLSIAISFGCLVINFAVLISINQKPLTSWRVANVDVTPNALISIFATISKSSMLYPVAEGISQLKWIFFQRNAYTLSYLEIFDYASRGPLGALNSLWRLKFQAMLASVGAIVTVLAIAIDPFTQQILSYPTVPVNATNATTSLGSAKSLGWNFEFAPGILQGVFAPSTLNTVSCPTAKCKWPAYKTLGICSECTEESPSSIINCHNETTFHPQCSVLTGNDPHFTLEYKFLGDYVGWKLMEIAGKPYNGECVWLIATQEPPAYYYKDTHYGQTLYGDGKLVSFSFLCAEKAIVRSSDGKPVPDATLTRCSLSLCEQTYPESHFKDGVFETSTPSSERLDFGYNCTGVYDESLYHVMCPGITSNTSHDAREYWVSMFAADNMLQTVAEILKNGEINRFLESPPKAMTASVLSAFSTVFNHNVSHLMDSLAAGVNLHLRRGPNGTEVPGHALLPMVFVRVRWAWFAYPVTLVMLAVTFWIATVVFSCGENRFVWKSSSLALMFHGPRGWNVEDMQAERLRDMDEAAANMRAQLIREDGGNIGFIRSE